MGHHPGHSLYIVTAHTFTTHNAMMVCLQVNRGNPKTGQVSPDPGPSVLAPPGHSVTVHSNPRLLESVSGSGGGTRIFTWHQDFSAAFVERPDSQSVTPNHI